MGEQRSKFTPGHLKWVIRAKVIWNDPLWTKVRTSIKLSIDWSADLQLFYRGFIVTTLLSSILHYSSLVDDPKVDLSIYLGYSNAHLLFSHLEPVYKSICRPIHIFCGPNIDLSDIFENTKIFLGHFWTSFEAKTFGWVFEKMSWSYKIGPKKECRNWTKEGLRSPVWIIFGHFWENRPKWPKIIHTGPLSFRENQTWAKNVIFDRKCPFSTRVEAKMIILTENGTDLGVIF